MRDFGEPKKLENEDSSVDRVIIQILVPRYAGLKKIFFPKVGKETSKPIPRGRPLPFRCESEVFEIRDGVLILSLVLN